MPSRQDEHRSDGQYSAEYSASYASPGALVSGTEGRWLAGAGPVVLCASAAAADARLAVVASVGESRSTARSCSMPSLRRRRIEDGLLCIYSAIWSKVSPSRRARMTFAEPLGSASIALYKVRLSSRSR